GRRVLGDVAEQDQTGAERSFQKDEYAGEQREEPDLVFSRELNVRPDTQRQNREHGESAADAVAELDEGLNPGRLRHHLPVTERPMVSASVTGATGAYICAPCDHQHVEGENTPCKAAKGRMDAGGRRGNGGPGESAHLLIVCPW